MVARRLDDERVPSASVALTNDTCRTVDALSPPASAAALELEAHHVLAVMVVTRAAGLAEHALHMCEHH